MPNPQTFEKEWNRRKQGAEVFRNRTLERLYSRRAVVDDLIRSLENYQRFPLRKGPGECIPIRKCS